MCPTSRIVESLVAIVFNFINESTVALNGEDSNFKRPRKSCSGIPSLKGYEEWKVESDWIAVFFNRCQPSEVRKYL